MIQTWMNAVLLQLCPRPAFVWFSQVPPPLQYNYSGQIPEINIKFDWQRHETFTEKNDKNNAPLQLNNIWLTYIYSITQVYSKQE